MSQIPEHLSELHILDAQTRQWVLRINSVFHDHKKVDHLAAFGTADENTEASLNARAPRVCFAFDLVEIEESIGRGLVTSERAKKGGSREPPFQIQNLRAPV